MIGTIKDRNWKHLTESKEVKKWKQYIVVYKKKDLNDPDKGDHSYRARHLECKVKCSLGSITTNKASEVMEFQLSYFKS